MTFALESLIKEAGMVLGSDACANGNHDWQSDGGRSCPKDLEDCSQAVYRCATCGNWDYGYEGGPAHRECFVACRRQPDEEIGGAA